MQIPFVGFQPIRTSEHMAAAGTTLHHSSPCICEQIVNFLILEKPDPSLLRLCYTPFSTCRKVSILPLVKLKQIPFVTLHCLHPKMSVNPKM